MILIMEQIKLEHLELLALEFGRKAESDLVYTLASTNNNQSAPNLVKIYDHKISDEFDHGSNRTRTVWVICPWICKIAESDFV